jgi:hypothetical protein
MPAEALALPTVITIHQGLRKLFPPTWQHLLQMGVSIVVPIFQRIQ